MKHTLKSIIVLSIFAVLATSCSTRIDVKDLTGFWQGESGRGFQFTDKGTYFFYFIENDIWKCSGDSENNFSVNGNVIRCEWIENGEIKVISYSVKSFSKQKMKLCSGSEDISDGNYIKVPEPSRIDVKDRKLALADSVLEELDLLYLSFNEQLHKGFFWWDMILTENEKMVKPDCFLDPSFTRSLVTKSQKINALAIYIVDVQIMKLYDMPLDDVKEAIARLIVELNHPVDVNAIAGSEMPGAERTRSLYEECKKRGELYYFWQFHSAFLTETAYVVAQNPELVFSKISEESWQGFVTSVYKKNMAMRELAKYDAEMATIARLYDKCRVTSSDEEMLEVLSTLESSKQFFIANKSKFSTKRNALIY